MKTLLFGSRGYLGEQFKLAFPGILTPSADIADAKAVAQILDQEKPDVVINCAGKTGRPNVDWCEDHKEETVHSNVTGALVLAEECLKRGVFLAHLSSGCIYTGDNGGKGFSETDPPNFDGSFYSRTKAWSDRILSEFPVLILRIRMPFDGSPNDRNLIMKLRKYPRVLDEANSLTYLPEFTAAAKLLIEKKSTGIFNVVNDGAISPYRIMELYREIVDPSHKFERLTAEHLGEVVKAGRSNCVLSTAKARSAGVILSPAEDVVRVALQSLKTSLKA